MRFVGGEYLVDVAQGSGRSFPIRRIFKGLPYHKFSKFRGASLRDLLVNLDIR